MPSKTRSAAAAGTAAADAAAADAAAADAAAADTTTTTSKQQQQQKQAPSMPNKKKPNDISLQNLADLIEYHVQMILLQKVNRIQHWEALKFFWGLHPANDFNYGRLHNRVRLAELLYLACSKDAYSYEEAESNQEKSLLSLVQWPRSQWSEFGDLLEELQTDLQRQDATVEIKGTLEDLQLENDETVRDDEKLAPKKLENLQTLVEIHQVLAPIRVALQQHLNDPSVSIPNKDIQKVGKEIFRLENPSVKETLQFLLEESSTSTRQKKHYQLGDLDAIRAILDDKTFDLRYFQNKMESLVHKWNNTVFVGSDPELIRASYRMSKDARNMLKIPKDRRASLMSPMPTKTTRKSKKKKKKNKPPERPQQEEDFCPAFDDVEDEDANKKPRAKAEAEILALQKGRETLGQHVDDPLEESQVIAAGAKKRRAQVETSEEEEDETMSPAAKRAKSVARSLQISEDLDEDDQEEEERAKLSTVPKKARTSSAGRAQKYTGPPPDEGLFDEEGKVLKRRRWSEEEKIAVKEGVKEHGVGKWKEIKVSYAEILRNRTPVQIKDCWRTMTKRNEVYEEV